MRDKLRLLFRMRELFSVLVLYPGRASVNTYSSIAFGQCFSEFFKPIDDSVKIERTSFEKPSPGQQFLCCRQPCSDQGQEELVAARLLLFPPFVFGLRDYP